MSLDLILLRHGAAEHTPHRRYAGSGTDSDLIPEGEREAAAAAAALADSGAGAVWSGTLIRQVKTAAIVAAALGVGHHVTPALDELDFGAWEGRTKEEIADLWPEAFEGWDERSVWPEGVFGGSRDRVMRAFDDWVGEMKAGGGTVVAVTSNGLLRLLARRYLGDGNGPYGVWTGHGCRLEIGEAVRVRRWNAPPRDIA